jgi:hypothetical protein
MKNIGSIRVRQAAAILAMIFALSQPIAAQAMPGGFHGAGGFHGGSIHAVGLHGFGRPLLDGDHFDHLRAERISYGGGMMIPIWTAAQTALSLANTRITAQAPLATTPM